MYRGGRPRWAAQKKVVENIKGDRRLIVHPERDVLLFGESPESPDRHPGPSQESTPIWSTLYALSLSARIFPSTHPIEIHVPSMSPSIVSLSSDSPVCTFSSHIRPPRIKASRRC